MAFKCDVLIVGGGTAGLSCARNLSKGDKSIKILLLEAESRLGGRIHTIEYEGNPLELGAQWIHGRGKTQCGSSSMKIGFNFAVLMTC